MPPTKRIRIINPPYPKKPPTKPVRFTDPTREQVEPSDPVVVVTSQGVRDPSIPVRVQEGHEPSDPVRLTAANRFDFDPNSVLNPIVFTPNMVKRATSIFAAAPIVQGNIANTPSDQLSYAPGTDIDRLFKPGFDSNQGTIVLFWTPEYGTGGPKTSGAFLYFFSALPDWHYLAYSYTANRFSLACGGGIAVYKDFTLVAGTTYKIVVRWDNKRTLDGTNNVCLSIDDVHTFGASGVCTYHTGNVYIGSGIGSANCDGIIQGFTIYRRVLWDGAYGVNVGNGDEVNLISAGIDPCTITGSWDVVFCLPTNASTGALVTGTGNAWSHPHASNLIPVGLLSDSYYGGELWALKFGATTLVNFGSGATLDNLPNGAVMQVEGWFKYSFLNGGVNFMLKKLSAGETLGWRVWFAGSAQLYFTVHCATTNATAYTSTTDWNDGHWHHFVGHYDDSIKTVRLAIDGHWVASGVGSGAYTMDDAYNLMLGQSGNNFGGSIGWLRIHNHAHYTPGTDFTPSRVFPGVDANTVEAWRMHEGTGAVATAEVTVPGNNGTITNGTWERQWELEGTPRIDYSLGKDNYLSVNVGSGATIDNLHDGAMTIEGWFRARKSATAQMLCSKQTPGVNGWQLRVTNGLALQGLVRCATTTPIANGQLPDENWHYIKMTFDDAGDRAVRIYVDNVLNATSGNGVGAIVSDAGVDGALSTGTGSESLIGSMGWVRWSNVIRGAGMIPRSNPPAVDANTMAQWNMTDGPGTVLTDVSGNANHGTIALGDSVGLWCLSPGMEYDSPKARVFSGGYVFGNDAANEGTKFTLTGLGAQTCYVLRALAFSEDGIGQPEVVVYDETNAAIITVLAGTLTSTETVPDILLLSFELPTVARGAAANCTSISIKLINISATGVVGFHQVELLLSSLPNPSFNGIVADPYIPYDFSTYSLDPGDTARENAITHSSGYSVRYNTSCTPGEGVARSNGGIPFDRFYSKGFYFYNDGATINSFYEFWDNRYYLHSKNSGYAEIYTPSPSAAWKLYASVDRKYIDFTSTIFFLSTTAGAVAPRYLDDAYLFLLDDVSLTCTPCSKADSAEAGGIRVDGYDICTQPIPAELLLPTIGWLRFRYKPRHGALDVLKFGTQYPMLANIFGDVNNLINIYWDAVNQLKLEVKSNGGALISATWAPGANIVAGGNYLFEIFYTGTKIQLSMDGVARITITTPILFTTVPNTLYAGNYFMPDYTYNPDAVFASP